MVEIGLASREVDLLASALPRQRRVPAAARTVDLVVPGVVPAPGVPVPERRLACPAKHRRRATDRFANRPVIFVVVNNAAVEIEGIEKSAMLLVPGMLDRRGEEVAGRPPGPFRRPPPFEQHEQL